ncbi:MAG: hypothetical protein ACFFAY_09110 [Promethearchaeota archaeon]
MPSKKSHEINAEEVHRLYFEEELTQRQIAHKLGLSSHAPINKIFKVEGWSARPAAPRREEVDAEDVYRLYFIKKLTMREVAEQLGLKGYSPIQRTFKENGWKSRGRWGKIPTRRRKFENETDRKLAKKERYKNQFLRIKQLREEIFGSECKICDLSNSERTLAIHRKDFKEHKDNQLWIKGYLQSLNPEDWALLCVACHRGVHWLKDQCGMDWSVIEIYHARRKDSPQRPKKPLSLPNENTPSSSRYRTIIQSKNDIGNLRGALFGEKCNFCGKDYKSSRLVTHRKDGRPHESNLLTSEKCLRTLNPDEWVQLCQRCHRYVHWAEDSLGLSWNDLTGNSFRSDLQLEEFKFHKRKRIEMI